MTYSRWKKRWTTVRLGVLAVELRSVWSLKIAALSTASGPCGACSSLTETPKSMQMGAHTMANSTRSRSAITSRYGTSSTSWPRNLTQLPFKIRPILPPMKSGKDNCVCKVKPKRIWASLVILTIQIWWKWASVLAFALKSATETLQTSWIQTLTATTCLTLQFCKTKPNFWIKKAGPIRSEWRSSTVRAWWLQMQLNRIDWLSQSSSNQDFSLVKPKQGAIWGIVAVMEEWILTN